MEDKVLKVIEEDINEQMNLVVEQIQQETKKLENDRISHFVKRLDKEIEIFLHNELHDLKIWSKTESSKENLEMKRKVLETRAKLVEQLFAEIIAEIKNFCNSEKYASYLKEQIKQVPNKNLGIIMVSKRDLKLAKTIVSDLSWQVSVQETVLELGGFNYYDSTTQVEYDYTIDTKLSLQKEAFYANSKFTI